jgi:hypothetical protein
MGLLASDEGLMGPWVWKLTVGLRVSCIWAWETRELAVMFISYGLSCGLASFSSLKTLFHLTASYPRQVLRVQFMASMLMCWLSRRRSITGVRRELGLNDRGLVEDGG